MSDQPPVASRESRAQVRTDAPDRRRRLGAGHRAGPGHRLVPGPGLRAGGADRHAVGRPADRLGAGLRAGGDDRPLLRDQVPHEARRGAQGRPADPRQHEAGDHLDGDPGDPARRPLHLRLRRADRHREGARPTRCNVRVVGEQFTWTFYYPGEGGKEISSPQLWLPAEHAGQLHGPVQGRDPRLLGPGLPDEDRRGAGDRHAHPRDDHEPHGRVPGGVRRAVRPRALDDAPERARGDRARSSTPSSRSSRRARRAAAVAEAAAAARPTARRCSRTPPQPTACKSCHTLADAGATGTTGPNLDEVVPDLSDARDQASRSRIRTPRSPRASNRG